MKSPLWESVSLDVQQEAFASGLMLEPSLFPPGEADIALTLGKSSDDRAQFLPYSELLAEDPRKVDIDLGLGKLGLITMTPELLRRSGMGNRSEYAAEVLRYDVRLLARSRTLRIPGQLESEGFQADYPGVSQEWADQYARELTGLRSVLHGTRLFGEVERMRLLSPKIRRLHHQAPLPETVEVRRDAATGALRIVPMSRAPRSGQPAALVSA